MSNTTFSNSTSAKGFGPKRDKTIVRSSWRKDVYTFIRLFGSLQSQTGVPRRALESYNRALEVRLLNNGHNYLSKTRSYPIYGIRYLGGDVLDDRSPSNFFTGERLRPNADGVLVPKFLSWYWNRLWYYGKMKNPSKSDSLNVSRILAVLSFSKFLLLDTKKARSKAFDDYVDRINNVNGKVPLEFNMSDDDPAYKSMLEFLRLTNSHTHAGYRIQYDRRSFSLKCLVGKKPYRPTVPPAYSIPNWKNLPVLGTGAPSNEPNDLVDAVQRYYYSKKPYDAKLTIIAESGGKYRGICPYESPYAHTINLFGRCRSALLKLKGNCNYDQARGHTVARYLSRDCRALKVSVDASNFTDTMNVEYLAHMAKAIGSSGAVHYCSRLRVLKPDGNVVTGCPPLMGWKGTFDLASLVLAWSVWKQFGCLDKSRVQCGDDFLGIGTLEDFRASYDFLGLELSESKTVISKTCTVFCGESYWRGLEITPVRFLFTGINETHKFVGKLIARTRDFIQRCNYSKSCKRTIFAFLRKRIGERYNGYLDFRLSSDLGGIPLLYYPVGPLVPYLENNRLALQCALCNIPIDVEERTWQNDNFSHLPLGKPYNIFGLLQSLTHGSWPVKSRSAFGAKRRHVRKLLNSNRADVSDVLLYIYDNTPLTA